MKRIGLIGEDPNDTQAIHHLLSQKFKGKLHFKTILRNKRGYQLENASAVNALGIELSKTKFDLIIFIRDLDGLQMEKQKLKARQTWFMKLNALCNDKGLLLLNIYELEALILADIETFNNVYKTTISNIGDVMFKTDPKKFLIAKTYSSQKRYSESHCPELFKKLRYETVRSNCRYFKEFTTNLEKKLKSIR